MSNANLEKFKKTAQTNSVNNNAKKDEVNYFNLHLSGIGYVNDVREITPKKGNPYVVCKIAALRGDSNDMEYTYISITSIAGKKANDLMSELVGIDTHQHKIFASFVIGDIYAESYINKEGKPGANIKGRLIRIKTLKIDDEVIYAEAANNDTQNAANAPKTPAENVPETAPENTSNV